MTAVSPEMVALFNLRDRLTEQIGTLTAERDQVNRQIAVARGSEILRDD
jgi:hypothetical protein